MKTLALTVAASAVLVAVGASALSAHQAGAMMQPVQPGADEIRAYPQWMGQGHMMGPGMVGSGMMMGGGMLGHGMPHMMTIMMDAGGDGVLSVEEFQAVHTRVFNAMDINGEGRLAPEEMEQFMGGAWSAPDQDR